MDFSHDHKMTYAETSLIDYSDRVLYHDEFVFPPCCADETRTITTAESGVSKLAKRIQAIVETKRLRNM